MANTITFVKRSALPEPIKGKAGAVAVTVGGNGQIILSSAATRLLGDAKQVVMAFQGMTAWLFVPDAPLVQKGKIETKDMIELKFPKKGNVCGFSATRELRNMTEWGATAQYDYTASGNQTFPATYDEKQKGLYWELATGLKPKPIVARAKKATKAKAGTPTVGTPHAGTC